jgi:hypothetical protein
MSVYHWYPALGWFTFFVTFVVGIILYANFKKFYNIFYLISVALYVFTAGFMIDVFDFSKLGILLTLSASALIFMLLGYYLSTVFGSESSENRKR